MSLRCMVTLQYGNLSLGLVYLLKRFIMVKKRFTILICHVDGQKQTFICGVACHRCSTFSLCKLINVFSYV